MDELSKMDELEMLEQILRVCENSHVFQTAPELPDHNPLMLDSKITVYYYLLKWAVSEIGSLRNIIVARSFEWENDREDMRKFQEKFIKADSELRESDFQHGLIIDCLDKITQERDIYAQALRDICDKNIPVDDVGSDYGYGVADASKFFGDIAQKALEFKVK